MTQYLQLPAQCNVQPCWPDLAHLIAGTPAWQRDRDRAIARAGVARRCVNRSCAVSRTE